MMEKHALSLAAAKKEAKKESMRTKSSRVLFSTEGLGIEDTTLALEDLLEVGDDGAKSLGSYKVMSKKKVQVQKTLSATKVSVGEVVNDEIVEILETKLDKDGAKKAKIRAKKKSKDVVGWVPCDTDTLKKVAGKGEEENYKEIFTLEEEGSIGIMFAETVDPWD